MPPDTVIVPSRFIDRLRNGGIEVGDSEETRLAKSLLMLATGLTSMAAMLWVALYWAMGPQFSSTLPFLFQLLLAGNIILYALSRNFDFFQVSQLGMFLFLPFIAQWSIGNFISSSGVVLWGLLAPIGALLCFGVSQSLGWFIAWAVLTALTGAADYYLATLALKPGAVFGNVPIPTAIVFFALNFIAVATIIYLLLRHSITERRKTQDVLEHAHQRLSEEQERSEKLLLNILPGPVAERLKSSDQTIADGFSDVTVMFADIVNFTQVAGNMTPSQVFTMLNRIFSAFDELAERFEVEKIKTIGDAYMVAGGINQSAENYTGGIVDMAIAMRDLLARDFSINASKLQIRIGIGTGPVVAGVVGKKKFIYDLWGDTVNLASRLTSECNPGDIQCDSATHDRLKGMFEFSDVTILPLKGKGALATYRIAGRRRAHSVGAL
ncbi:MAG: adenylate/guanylate cyclase domain-containing protein [Rhodocyclaceae bacterium]|nr:adenylate/guanylate cyclase domain-containing protein [Rhodocyclaceae bacterium]